MGVDVPVGPGRESVLASPGMPAEAPQKRRHPSGIWLAAGMTVLMSGCPAHVATPRFASSHRVAARESRPEGTVGLDPHMQWLPLSRGGPP